MKCQDCLVDCQSDADFRCVDELGGPEYVYCWLHAPVDDPGVDLIAI